MAKGIVRTQTSKNMVKTSQVFDEEYEEEEEKKPIPKRNQKRVGINLAKGRLLRSVMEKAQKGAKKRGGK